MFTAGREHWRVCFMAKHVVGRCPCAAPSPQPWTVHAAGLRPGVASSPCVLARTSLFRVPVLQVACCACTYTLLCMLLLFFPFSPHLCSLPPFPPPPIILFMMLVPPAEVLLLCVSSTFQCVFVSFLCTCSRRLSVFAHLPLLARFLSALVLSTPPFVGQMGVRGLLPRRPCAVL